MYAIVNAAGRQRRVTPGEIVWFEKMEARAGDTITLDNVLLFNDGQHTVVGTPQIGGAQVHAQVLRQVRDRKVDVMKLKRRKGYVKRRGHRHAYTEARVTDICVAGQTYTAPKPESRPQPATEAGSETPPPAPAAIEAPAAQ